VSRESGVRKGCHAYGPMGLPGPARALLIFFVGILGFQNATGQASRLHTSQCLTHWWCCAGALGMKSYAWWFVIQHY
jgi:hypothetical protein